MKIDQAKGCFVKVRREGEKKRRFLAQGGRETNLRVHALQFTYEQAVLAVAQLGADNPGYEFQITQ